MQAMHQQMADMKRTMDERLHQAEQGAQEAQEAWQDAVTRATMAEDRARGLEKAISSFQERKRVNNIHQQLCGPNHSEAPNQQIIAAPEEDDPMGEITPDKGKSRERHSNGDDATMEEVRGV